MNTNWLEPKEWKWVQDHVPVACVDVLPVQRDDTGEVTHVGLIHRDTPHQGKRWCLVGGRQWRNESLTTAAARQLRETLGPGVRFNLLPHQQPHHVAEYFTDGRPGQLLDPRQHAVTLVFVVAITGDVAAGGEAHDFRWFTPSTLPAAEQFGFEQDLVMWACLSHREFGQQFRRAQHADR